MLIFEDIITGDEMFSDANDPKLVEGVIYEVDCKMIKKGGESFDIGANPSAEEADEGTDDNVTSVIDVVDNNRLVQSPFDKKSYVDHIKKYLKAVAAQLKEKGTSDEEIAAFQKGCQKKVAEIVKNFKDYDFYVGESMSVDGMVALLNYREDGTTPYITFWKHGLREVKC